MEANRRGPQNRRSAVPAAGSKQPDTCADITGATPELSSYCGSIVLFRDFDRIWHRVDNKTGCNKIGYVTRRYTVIHARLKRGMAETPLCRIRRRPHILIRMTTLSPADIEHVETFFTKNVPSFELLNSGLVALTTGQNLSYFDNPIRTPFLDKITREEFERRWAKFRSILRPADIIAIIDTKSRMSRLIARLDHGTWSHVGLYTVNGMILEAILQGVVERELEAYHSQRYRLGIYRATNSVSTDAAGAIISHGRMMLGLPYGFYNLFRLACIKIFNLSPRGDPARNLSPNDIARSGEVHLVHLV
jgi:hypothetical protein